MKKEIKKYILLDAIGNPISRFGGTEANPYIFYSLREIFKFAETELKNQDVISVVEIKEIEHFGSGK